MTLKKVRISRILNMDLEVNLHVSSFVVVVEFIIIFELFSTSILKDINRDVNSGEYREK